MHCQEGFSFMIFWLEEEEGRKLKGKGKGEFVGGESCLRDFQFSRIQVKMVIKSKNR